MTNHAAYNVALDPFEQGGFIVTVPILPGCFSYGATQEQAIDNSQPVPRATVLTWESDCMSMERRQFS